ncbi:MAG: hypothetical protein VBE63_16280 [Lamprobacter sp.]|uniref:hypothetical protein n=1 Tax=Lamprobacter sp. TaxID=3100796 RepID=UPI002B258479|nr:hypothetical protein [Lamprobacter sp.]MEA3641481.1 hypothetical protein [Lamprobacter sp.]
MHTVKAIYQNNQIQLLAPLQAADQTELLIVVLDQEGHLGPPAGQLHAMPTPSEEEFRAIGMASFFSDQDDQDVDWEEVFDVKAR